MHVFYGADALPQFRRDRLKSRLYALLPKLDIVGTQSLYLAWFKSTPTNEELKRLSELIGGTQAITAPNPSVSILVTPRIGTISPWSSKATDIAKNCGLNNLQHFERATRWAFNGITDSDLPIVAPFIHDRMTETLLTNHEAAHVLASTAAPQPLGSIALRADGISTLANVNNELGLALTEDEIEYLVERYMQLDRDPTDIELMMFAQVNSEHCRHKIFNAEWEIDNEPQKRSLFEMVRHTFDRAPSKVLSAYTDNSAVTTGYLASRFFADPKSSSYGMTEEDVHILMKVETHNHPTGIAPYPGAATGSGGEIRDEGATGLGATPKAGLVGFSVSHLRIPEFTRVWEQQRPQNPRLASAFEIMCDAPIGAAAFNNEFGRPILCGYFRCFEDHTVPSDVRGYDKPIMVAGGIGNIRAEHIYKRHISDGTKILVLGGPAMLIGLGGGAASSMSSGASDSELDFASVQRDNPEMERRCQEVINNCWSQGELNPLLSIHDVGAGGLANAIPEILHDSGRGGRFELRAIPSADPSMSPLAIWCNEAQERYVLAINPDRIEEFAAICARERCPMAVIGEATADEHLTVHDNLLDINVIDLPMDVIFGKPPKMSRNVQTHSREFASFSTTNIMITDAIHRVLSFPSVGDKRFLITIGDRNVGGLSARDQMVGRWQTPVADCAVTASSFGTYTGEAMAIGERAPVALLDAPASGRMAVGEALTNISSARIMRLGDIVLSANWMAAAGHPGEDTRLFETVRSVALELCPALGVVIPVGKDSMSMKSEWQNRDNSYSVSAPLSLIVSAFAPVVDIRQTLTPELQLDKGNTSLLLVDLACGHRRLGASILAQCYNTLGVESADFDNPAIFSAFFNVIQILNEAGYLLAYHDRSDGGLIVTLCEMAFAARSGINIDISELGQDPIAALFCEELGVIIQVSNSHIETVMKYFSETALADHIHLLGQPNQDGFVRIQSGTETIFESELATLLNSWSSNTFQMQQARDNPKCAQQELAAIVDPNDPGLYLAVTFEHTMQTRSAAVITARPRVAILREQGINGHVEMAAAFDRAGFDAVDVHMSDLIESRQHLKNFSGIAACGGFSYGDVLGAGGGWAKSILFNSQVNEIFADFFNRSDTFALGVCNGCQMLSHLSSLIPGAHNWPTFRRNLSEQFEARLVMAEILESPSILLREMAGTKAPIVVAHGEGRVDEQIEQNNYVCLRFVDNCGIATERYPYNPNGSVEGVTGLTSEDGRVTIMMPHPERVFLSTQYSWLEPSWGSVEGPWMKMFHNARSWLK